MAAPGPRPPPRDLAQLGLERRGDGSHARDGLLEKIQNGTDVEFFAYLEQWLGPTTGADWNAWSVVDPRIEQDIYTIWELLDYYTSVPLSTYQIIDINLVDINDERRTPMRPAEMIRTTWAQEAGAAQLQHLAAREVINEEARESIEREFDHAISQGAILPDALQVIIREARDDPLSPYWLDNPFNRAASGVARGPQSVIACMMRESADYELHTIMHSFYGLDAAVADPVRTAEELAAMSADALNLAAQLQVERDREYDEGVAGL